MITNAMTDDDYIDFLVKRHWRYLWCIDSDRISYERPIALSTFLDYGYVGFVSYYMNYNRLWSKNSPMTFVQWLFLRYILTYLAVAGLDGPPYLENAWIKK